MRTHLRRLCAVALALATLGSAGCTERRDVLIVWADRGADAVFGEQIAQYEHPNTDIEYRVYTHDFLWQSVKLGRKVDVILSGARPAFADSYGCAELPLRSRSTELVFVRTNTLDSSCCLLPEDGHLAAPAARADARQRGLTCTHVALHPHQLGRFLCNGQFSCGYAFDAQLDAKGLSDTQTTTPVATFRLQAYRREGQTNPAIRPLLDQLCQTE